jgi:hypothetical protein
MQHYVYSSGLMADHLGSSPSYEKLLELKLCPSKKIANFLTLYAFL